MEQNYTYEIKRYPGDYEKTHALQTTASSATLTILQNVELA